MAYLCTLIERGRLDWLEDRRSCVANEGALCKYAILSFACFGQISDRLLE